MVKVMVTGVDSSETALRAAQKAAELAEGFGAELHVVTAYAANDAYSLETEGGSDGSSPAASSTTSDGLASNARSSADAVAAELRAAHPELTVVASAGVGSPAEVLVGKAEALDADLIVVGNKRVQGLARILGSVARKVTAEASCNVYIVNTVHR